MPTLKHWLCLHHIRTSHIPYEIKSTARTQSRKSHSNGYKWEGGINSHLSSQLSPTFNINIINTCPTLLVWQIPAVYCDPSSEQSIERPHNGKTFMTIASCLSVWSLNISSTLDSWIIIELPRWTMKHLIAANALCKCDVRTVLVWSGHVFAFSSLIHASIAHVPLLDAGFCSVSCFVSFMLHRQGYLLSAEPATPYIILINRIFELYHTTLVSLQG